MHNIQETKTHLSRLVELAASGALVAISLPPLHGDPFGRALIAQCMEESLTFATRDRIAAEYHIPVLAV